MRLRYWRHFLWRLFTESEDSLLGRFMWLWEFGASMDVAARALLLAEGLYQGPEPESQSETTASVPFGLSYGICGVGLYALPTGHAASKSKGSILFPPFTARENIVPCLFVTAGPGLERLVTQPLATFAPAGAAITAVFGEEYTTWTSDVVVAPVSPMRPQADPGDPVQTSKTGQLGAPVSWGGGKGYLTAGHVGLSVGSVVYDDAGSRIGSIVYADDPTGVGSTAAPGIDVALVDLDSGIPWGNSLGIASAAVAKGLDNVDVYTRASLKSGPTMVSLCSKSEWFIVDDPPTPPTALRGVYLSSNGVTAAADSGGPVLLNGTKSIIGHIGAGGSNTSCFQDIRRQLRRIKSNSIYKAITL
jgi:hypothetical protein